MNYIKTILSLSILILAFGCVKNWDEHYVGYPETVNQNVWEVLQNENDISDYVKILKDFKYDTLFQGNSTYTLFIPTNEALAAFKADNDVDVMLLNYLITPHFIQSRGIKEKRKIQTLGDKFATFESEGATLKLDGVVLSKEGPLFKNGKFFIMDEVAPVKPNIYEFYLINNPVLKSYIDSQDSIIIDREKSIAKGFDENGNTIFDTVSIIYNKFEEAYFPVKHEFRYQTSTIVFPKEELYNEALTNMALNLNSPFYSDYKDIPLEWQNRILIPYLLKQGVFENMVEPEEFQMLPGTEITTLKNILGDSVRFDYKPVEKSICSNGYTYNYENFTIPDSLYKNASVFEMESLLTEIGSNTYAWNEGVKVQSSVSFAPNRLYESNASNDSLVSILFPVGYTGNFSVEFLTESLFPQKYLLVINTNMNYGGIYEIYVNDELIRTFDYYDFVKYRQYNLSVTGVRYAPKGNLNRFDMFVENIQEYGPAKVRLEYKEPGKVLGNGFLIDYISFTPYNN